MDGISSAIALAPLAVQLVNTVQQIIRFFLSIPDGPKQFSQLVEDLNQLKPNLDLVRLLIDQGLASCGFARSLSTLAAALQICESKVKKLEEFVIKAALHLRRRHPIQRSLDALKFLLRKEQLQEILVQIRDSTERLHTAILINSAMDISQYQRLPAPHFLTDRTDLPTD